MLQQHNISQAQYHADIAEPLPTANDLQQPAEPSAAPYFTSWLRPQILGAMGLGHGVSPSVAEYRAYYPAPRSNHSPSPSRSNPESGPTPSGLRRRRTSSSPRPGARSTSSSTTSATPTRGRPRSREPPMSRITRCSPRSASRSGPRGSLISPTKWGSARPSLTTTR
jgi:hypothetical protein